MIDPFQHFHLEDEGSDKSWLHQGFATLTPLNIDLNDRETAKKLNETVCGTRYYHNWKEEVSFRLHPCEKLPLRLQKKQRNGEDYFNVSASP